MVTTAAAGENQSLFTTTRSGRSASDEGLKAQEHGLSVGTVAEATVVYIVSRPPYPLRNGLAIRHFNLLRAYTAIADVKLVFLSEGPEALRACEPLRAYCSSIHPVSLDTTNQEKRRSRMPAWQRRLEYLIAAKPYAAAASYSKELRDIVVDLASSANLVHVTRLHMVPHVESLLVVRGHRPAFVLDLDEVETVARARWLKAGFARNRREWLLGYYDLARLWWYQRRAIRAFDRVFVCSTEDRVRLGRDNVVVIPNGADAPATELLDRSDGKTLMFCASLSWGPNAEAALFLIKEILPRVQREVSDARVLIVGSSPPANLRALNNDKSVLVRGDVPSVEEYYRQATVLVVPLRTGGGTRIKILEAFSHGVAVVSTTIGCEGLEVVNGEHLLVRDDAGGMAQGCVELLTNPALRRRLAAFGRSLVAEHYTWASVKARVVAVAQDLLGASRHLAGS